MSVDGLQDAFDRAALVSAQRWLLAVGGVLAAASASVVASLAAGAAPAAMATVIAVVATVAVVQPDSHAALVAVALVLGQWLVGVDDVDTPLALPTAVLLYGFHAVTSLLAVTPASAVLGADVLGRWARRSAVIVAATCVSWLVVAAASGWAVDDSVALTAFAFAVLAALALAARLRSRVPS